MVMDDTLLLVGQLEEALVLNVSAMPNGISAFHTALLFPQVVSVALAAHTYSNQLSLPAEGVMRAAALLVTPSGLRSASALASP
jgi:hypothetical protein